MTSARPIALAAFLVASCFAFRVASAAEIDRLVSWMTGTFSSAAQAAADSTYGDIRLQMIPIWLEHAPGEGEGADADSTAAARELLRWIYVEQAVASALDLPYRQRVYRLTAASDSTFTSDVFTIPDPLRFVGAGTYAAPLSSLTPDSLEARAGCSVLLRLASDGTFAGGTEGRDCESTLAGAAYTTSEVRISADQIVSWDRGFDAAGNQVWGATAGGYVFDRVPESELDK